jgi:diacylglycerol O-acyltransferase / wax synthase
VFATGLLHRLPPFNLCISNVPGPNVPVYLCGARLLAHYPMSVVTDGQGLNITVVGYLGQLHFGLVSCRELVPDIDDLAGYLVDELQLLLEAAGQRTADQGAAEQHVPGPRTAEQRAAEQRAAEQRAAEQHAAG